MKKTQAVLISIPLLLGSGLTWADLPTEGTKEFSLSGTGSSDKEFEDNLFSLDASYGQYISSASAFGVRQSVGVSDSENSDSQWNGATRVFYDYHFGRQNWRPFIGANVGYIYGDTVEETFIAGPEAGIKYYALPSTFIVGLIEYQFLFDDADEADNRFDDGAFAYSVGVGFNF